MAWNKTEVAAVLVIGTALTAAFGLRGCNDAQDVVDEINKTSGFTSYNTAFNACVRANATTVRSSHQAALSLQSGNTQDQRVRQTTGKYAFAGSRGFQVKGFRCRQSATTEERDIRDGRLQVAS